MDYFELAQGCSMRMCPELERKFPDFHGRQLELMMYLCLVAYESENYRGFCDDVWLRTTIKLKVDHVDKLGDHAHVFSYLKSREIKLMDEIFKGTPMCQSSWEQLGENYSKLTSRIKIRWNILPRRAHWERLQSGFIPITIIDQARQKGSFLKKRVDEWKKNGGRCDLATHLKSSVVQPTAPRASLWTIEVKDVLSMEQLGKGAATTVFKVLWRKGTYAMKSFDRPFFGKPFREREIAARLLLHPHIIHGFGYFEEGGKWRLLMEMLDTTLTRYANKEMKKRGNDEPLFSRGDTLDVLLQIASAVKHLHDKGVVHGNLKPANIVLELPENGRHFLARVTDFGDAEFFTLGRPFKPGRDGSTQFAEPELLE